MSTASAMVATTAWRRYAGDRRLVEVKQTAQEGLASHHEHARVGIKAREATVKRFDVHSGHGGASNGDGGVPVAVVDKTINQLVIEHHGIKAKLEPR